ncbi:hypothetical protein [Aquimarina sp. 2201CG5-10]|uniref:hypothetical protein n=1 Tax=Aquimarina callyspongiae TaxID=3098150 RepID=UPI002AB43F0B|nr:hypothetical protein [Aquimarina sp. 2201CG5-10]MDY8134438.1 hypothetical protein [Aquimarina sp. 2201CG5-10]
MRSILFLGVALFCTTVLFGQGNINDYKYIIVPEGYVFLKKNDSYQLNSLTRFLFKKQGYDAFMRGEKMPEDLIVNGCKALRVNVKKESGLFATKLIIELLDCNSNVVYTSGVGSSREKEYKKAYQEALRGAFKSIELLKYEYNGSKEVENIRKKESIASETGNKVVAKQKQNLPKPEKEIKAPKPLKKESVVPKITLPKEVTYVFNAVNYVFKQKEYGYELSKGENAQIGKVYSASRDNSYIVRAGELSGIGYFDAYGNFILERINPVTDKLIIDTFARQ